jgi:hypothetical protein
MMRAVFPISLMAAAMLPAVAQAADPPPRLASLECRVLEAAAAGLDEPVHASSADDGAFLADQLPHVAGALGLSEADVATVKARARAARAPYRPACWGELVVPELELVVPELDGLRKKAAFTRPIFLSAEAAVLQVRRDEYDRGGIWICVVRWDGVGWKPNCQQTLIWAR